MRVLLTGASGFVGQAVRRRIQEAGRHELFCLDRKDIPAAVAWKPDAVIHCAWGGVFHTEREDHDLQWENYDLTVRIASAVAGFCKRFIGVGSQSELSQPTICYSMHKRKAGLFLRDFCAARDISFAWARLYSVYGPGDSPNTFIPYVIRTLLAGQDVPLTDQNIPWDWLYVDDAADALIRLAETPNATGEFEVGFGASPMTQDVARMLRDKINPAAKLLFGARPRREKEIPALLCSYQRLWEATHWAPTVALDEGLDWTIAWFRAQHQEIVA